MCHFDPQILPQSPNAKWDIYYKPNWSVPKMRLLCPGVPGQTVFVFPNPDPNSQSGFWTALDAEDDDGDGLSNGYETWFLHSHGYTMIDVQDSDFDGMRDGWEVGYGLDPTDNTVPNGGAGNPDGDTYSNVQEFISNPLFAAPSYDPVKPYGSTAPGLKARPIISISTSSSQAQLPGGTATFTIQRSIGLGADLSQPLTVYYSLGGSATYGSDYGLSTALPEFPRIFSAVIGAEDPTVTVTLTPSSTGVKQAGLQTVIVKLVPFGVATDPQTSNPLNWLYVLDLFHEAVTLNIWNGILINLEKTPQNGYLRIKTTSDTSPLPFINVANSVRGTMARIYTGTNLSSDRSSIAGEFFSAPANMDRDPSRTTVDRYGNVWVGNRAEISSDGGSITEYGIVIGGTRCDANGTSSLDGEYLKAPFIYNTCVDRHGAAVTDPPDGLIHTSRGSNPILPWSNSGGADTLGGVSTADDEAILRYVRVASRGVRTVIVDPNNNLWVGSTLSWHEFIDTGAGMPVTGWRLNFQGGGYGGVIDGYGAMWSSGFTVQQEGAPRLLRFLPGTAMPVTTGGTIRHTGDNYGITVDPNSGDVWQPLYSTPNVMQFRSFN